MKCIAVCKRCAYPPWCLHHGQVHERLGHDLLAARAAVAAAHVVRLLADARPHRRQAAPLGRLTALRGRAAAQARPLGQRGLADVSVVRPTLFTRVLGAPLAQVGAIFEPLDVFWEATCKEVPLDRAPIQGRGEVMHILWWWVV